MKKRGEGNSIILLVDQQNNNKLNLIEVFAIMKYLPFFWWNVFAFITLIIRK